MSRETWSIVKQSKQFYVSTYRKAGSSLIVSMLLNLGLGILVYYLYFHQPEHDFYATNGVTAPVQLTSLDQANDTSVPLLASDPDNENENKVIPE